MELLLDLTRQIYRAYGRDEPKYSSLSDLIDTFHDSLEFATKENPLFVYLDAVDNVSVPITMEDTEWLPETLPKYAKLLISITHPLDEKYSTDLLKDIQDKIINTESFLEIDVLGDMDAFKVIQSRLYEHNRGLSEKQAISIALLVQKCTHPMYLKFLGNTVVKWPSFYIFDPEFPPIAESTEEIVFQVSLQ